MDEFGRHHRKGHHEISQWIISVVVLIQNVAERMKKIQFKVLLALRREDLHKKVYSTSMTK